MDDTIQNLYIVDDEYHDNHPNIKKIADDIQSLWNRYIQISNDLLDSEKSITGAQANNYLEFINMAKETLGTEISDINVQLSKDMETYIDQINNADEKLYD